MKYLTKRKGKPRGRGRKTIKRGGGEETKTFPDGTYVGNIVNDKRQGVGKMTYENGEIYDGSWSNDKKQGNGKMTYKNGGVFESEWRNDLASDYGTMIYANGDNYKGYMIDGMKTNGLHGFSTMKYANGDVYFGNWKNDMREGDGTMTYNNEDKYTGNWENDMREGDGTMTYNNKDKYTGNWANDMREGVGKMTYQSGEIYEGNWHEDTRSKFGKAKIKYPNGDQYKGDLVDDLKQGYGEMYYANGDYYAGDWFEDKKSGRGTMKYANEDVYEGDWANDMRQGHGVAYDYDTDTRYEGDWNNDVPMEPFRPRVAIDTFQIHKFTANIDFQELNAFLKDHTSKDQDLPPLYHDQPPTDKFNVFIFNSIMSIMNQETDTERSKDFKRVMDNTLNNLNYAEFTPKLLTGVYLSLKYTLLQPEVFKEAYVDSYLDDTCRAHGEDKSIGSLSCAGGSLERFVTSLAAAATTALTTDTINEEQKQEYNKLIEMITRNLKTLIQKLIEEWQYGHRRGENFTNADGTNIVGKEARRANLKEHIEETVTNNTPEINELIEELIKEFADSIGYDDDQFPQGGRRTRKRRRKGKMTKTRKKNVQRKGKKRG